MDRNLYRAETFPAETYIPVCVVCYDGLERAGFILDVDQGHAKEGDVCAFCGVGYLAWE